MSGDNKPNSKSDEQTTHFGYETVPVAEKAQRVGQVFHSVASKYDVMNDLMSLGTHRLVKRFTVELSRSEERRVGKECGSRWSAEE